jgi:hypothetical protein
MGISSDGNGLRDRQQFIELRMLTARIQLLNGRDGVGIRGP